MLTALGEGQQNRGDLAGDGSSCLGGIPCHCTLLAIGQSATGSQRCGGLDQGIDTPARGWGVGDERTGLHRALREPRCQVGRRGRGPARPRTTCCRSWGLIRAAACGPLSCSWWSCGAASCLVNFLVPGHTVAAETAFPQPLVPVSGTGLFGW